MKFGQLGSWVGRVTSRLSAQNGMNGQGVLPSLHESVDQAKRDWLCARAYFEQVTDPDLVDYAIYQVKAAERRYMYLLGQARTNSDALIGSR